MPHQYRITVQSIDRESDELTFRVSNHDDLIEVAGRMRTRGLLPEEEVIPFTIGLKLFTEVLIRHRRDPLFEDLWKETGRFMKRLKGDGAAGTAAQ